MQRDRRKGRDRGGNTDVKKFEKWDKGEGRGRGVNREEDPE
jgi:hypothetical protein